MVSLALALLSAVAAAESAPDNPLLPAEAGNVQCYEPDDAKKTCRSISSYHPLGDQQYSSTTTVLISRVSSMTLETTSPVEVKNGAICGLVKPDDIATSKVRIADRLLDPVEAKPYLETIQKSLKALIGKEVCSTYVAAPEGLISKVTINGEYRANTDEHMKWLSPSESYTVAP